MDESCSLFCGGVAAKGGDADAGRGRGDAAAEGASVGRAPDRGQVGVQPYDGSPVSSGRWLGRLPRYLVQNPLNRSWLGKAPDVSVPRAKFPRRAALELVEHP